MPELPDVEVYVESLDRRIRGEKLVGIRLRSPFLLRSVAPPLATANGRAVTGVRRIGKRIVIDLDGGLHLVVHLMIAGRFSWEKPGAKLPGKIGLAAFDFSSGTLLLREAGTKKRASLHLVEGDEALRAFDRGGLEVIGAPAAAFREALLRENHTLKRSLTDPRLFSGIGNAYSDEILHRARLSPMKQTSRLDDAEIARLHAATQEVLELWTRRLREEAGGDFPRHVTAFREGMAVHGRFREPCPECGAPVQRIVYAENECNYCARCQNEGRLLADRALSRLLKSDWPRTLEELEELRLARAPTATPAPEESGPAPRR
jgi:formamidopyrimidine-DNA glycosylase